MASEYLINFVGCPQCEVVDTRQVLDINLGGFSEPGQELRVPATIGRLTMNGAGLAHHTVADDAVHNTGRFFLHTARNKYITHARLQNFALCGQARLTTAEILEAPAAKTDDRCRDQRKRIRNKLQNLLSLFGDLCERCAGMRSTQKENLF